MPQHFIFHNNDQITKVVVVQTFLQSTLRKKYSTQFFLLRIKRGHEREKSLSQSIIEFLKIKSLKKKKNRNYLWLNKKIQTFST